MNLVGYFEIPEILIPCGAVFRATQNLVREGHEVSSKETHDVNVSRNSSIVLLGGIHVIANREG